MYVYEISFIDKEPGTHCQGKAGHMKLLVGPWNIKRRPPFSQPGVGFDSWVPHTGKQDWATCLGPDIDHVVSFLRRIDEEKGTKTYYSNSNSSLVWNTYIYILNQCRHRFSLHNSAV